jgi:dephospho-CoA kinase
VALTGGIATGKSYVRARLEALGVPTVDADALAREVVAPGTPGLAAVVARFGPSALDAGGGLDRARLAALVFDDPDARRDLEAVVHPRVRAAIDAWFDALPDPGTVFAVADIPLLFETGRAGAFDVVVVTACPPALQIRRLRERDGLTAEDARRRLAAQWPVAEKVRLADYVIHTEGAYAETDAQVARVVDALRARADREARREFQRPS